MHLLKDVRRLAFFRDVVVALIDETLARTPRRVEALEFDADGTQPTE
jgi:predicted RNA methylase